ncbi:similar to An01g01930 [Aspergillus niger]|uniref:Similar to An01g01930 n=1 Tax=Aspergillus niger TaxID=5061 RepID=A0A100I1X6_ASPNG|nr:similar to An01g01930 [Aspergillus niger]
MTNKHPHKPSISASSLGQVRKIYMSKMTEQGCSRTLKDKCRDIWDKVIDDAVEADAECSGMGFAYGYGKVLEPVYIPDKPNGLQKKENGKKEHHEGSTESETESEEESNSETEVEIDPSLDGSDLLLDHMDDIFNVLELQVTNLKGLRDRLARGLEQVNATFETLNVEEKEASQGEAIMESLSVEEKEASQGEKKVVKKESGQNQHQHHAAKSPVTKSPKHGLSPPAKVKVQESDGDADCSEVEVEKEDFNTLFG